MNNMTTTTKPLIPNNYQLIINSEPFLDNPLSVVRTSDELGGTLWRGQEWGHADSRLAILSLVVYCGDIIVSSALAADASPQAFFQ
jgi:hypothetical protein